ncbi:hypothetical protein B0H66DRAFT_320278 [Apodospora peruviana]|uniref:Uncharacterized protein n=1 Tax=Apodospora peruviana TaxID=516989 RepID=A0AAE0M0I5_9PEZI|nr:hypothetical protein B0H66DRAFT_320278 [Apodospora peruviana]
MKVRCKADPYKFGNRFPLIRLLCMRVCGVGFMLPPIGTATLTTPPSIQCIHTMTESIQYSVNNFGAGYDVLARVVESKSQCAADPIHHIWSLALGTTAFCFHAAAIRTIFYARKSTSLECLGCCFDSHFVPLHHQSRWISPPHWRRKRVRTRCQRVRS